MIVFERNVSVPSNRKYPLFVRCLCEKSQLMSVSCFVLLLIDGKLHRIYERVSEGGEAVMKGPETVVFGNDGTLYVLTEEAKLVSLTDFEEEGGINMTAKATEVMHLGMGRPLGGKFAADGTLYVADALLGLIRVQNPKQEGAKVELVASGVKVEEQWSRLLYTNDVDVGPKTGMVYFTDCKFVVLYASTLKHMHTGQFC